MNITKQEKTQILKQNLNQFLSDLKCVYYVYVYAKQSNSYLQTTKKQVIHCACRDSIRYTLNMEKTVMYIR